jgi:hypothetical protein
MHPKFQTPKPVKTLFSVASVDERSNLRSRRTRIDASNQNFRITENPRQQTLHDEHGGTDSHRRIGDALHAYEPPRNGLHPPAKPIEDVVLFFLSNFFERF